jgi:GNAT superfamily N-acetyltransferase
MPRPDEQPAYYATLRDVAARAANPAIHVLCAVDDDTEALLGTVDFIDDLGHYGAAGSIAAVGDGAGIRLLAVAPGARGRGIGKGLAVHCLREAHARGKPTVVLHTTRAMATAWAMYERLGFVRAPALDFDQQALKVFGFRYDMPPPRRPP